MLGITVCAQQVNGTFDAEWEKCYPWEKGAPATQENGTTPQGWTISNVPAIIAGMPKPIGEQVENEEGYAVKLANYSLLGNLVPAYITLGTSWATAQVSGLKPVDGTADGGAFGGIAFPYKPDGIRLQYKRDCSNGEERASVIAYLWNGSWSQADVPSNTVMSGEPTQVTLTDRDRNILGLEATVGGEISHTEDAQLIATLEEYITEQQDEWATFEAYFNYGENAGADVSNAKLNIIISANDYFADRNLIVGNNSLTIDNVEMIYNSQLADLKFKGETVTDFDKDVYSYEIDAAYNENDIEAVKNCAGGVCEAQYNEESAVLTITVKGDDWSEENPNEHSYTVQFKQNGTSVRTVKSAAQAFDVYTLTGVQVRHNATTLDGLQKGIYLVNGKKHIVK